MNKHHHHNKNHNKKNRSKRSQSRIPEDENLGGFQPFEIRTSDIMGRYMVATKQFQPGDVILSEDPLVVGPCTNPKIQCLACYKCLENVNPITVCPGCGWPLCSLKCPGINYVHGHTTYECRILKECKSARFLNFKSSDSIALQYNVVVPLRCLLLKENNTEVYGKLMEMETHNEIRRNIPELWKNNQINIVDRLRDDWGLKKFSSEEIHSICGILEVNSFEIGQQGVNIRGIYPTAYLMSHDCIPNTNHIDSEHTFTLTVRASTKIPQNHPITLSYAYTLQSTMKRRQHLLENKFFECQCQRCSDPTEMGTYTGALLCPKCQTGFVLSTAPLNSTADWSCTNRRSCPGYTISAKAVTSLVDRVAAEVDNIDCNDVATMENFLQKYRNVLHPSHFLCLGVKLSLSQLYGKISGYLIHELNETQLVHKHSICAEILRVFDVIEPGYTRLRGVTLYEMHAPLMILLTRQFESHCSKSELRQKLKTIVRCLEEASVILGFEPENSPEGVMGVAAKDALSKIRQWENILGRL